MEQQVAQEAFNIVPYLITGIVFVTAGITTIFWLLLEAKKAEIAKLSADVTYEKDQKTDLIEDLNSCQTQKLKIVSAAKHKDCPQEVSDAIDRIIA